MHVDTVDFTFPEPRMFRPPVEGASIRKPFWDVFFAHRIQKIFERGGLLVDIGGGLRIDGSRGDKVNPVNKALFEEYLHSPNVQYKVTDYTDKYSPDFVEDIHALSFADASLDGVFCLAVLEHVYDPKKAAEEIVRVLKKGAEGFLYVPFMYRYHANVTEDYKDYFRYSKDGIAYLFRACELVELCPVRGLFESLLRFTPLHTFKPLAQLLRWMDWGSAKMRLISERQTSGYFIRIRK